MASGGNDNDLSCPVCTNLFEWPLQLHCGHTFCEKCVDSTISRAKRVWDNDKLIPEFLDFPCPECKNKNPVPQGTSEPLRQSFSVNWILKRMAGKAEEQRVLSMFPTTPRTTKQNMEQAFTHHAKYYAEAIHERQGMLAADVKGHSTIHQTTKQLEALSIKDNDDEDNYDIRGPKKSSDLQSVTPCHYGDKDTETAVCETKDQPVHEEAIVPATAAATSPEEVQKNYALTKPVPFIETNKEGKFVINQEAARILNEIHQPVVVVAIVGDYRTGKSYLMNRLHGESKGFSLGSTVQSHTKGFWIWCRPHPTQEGTWLVLIDTEGLNDSVKRDGNHDTKMFSLAVLICNCLIYNSVGKIDNKAIQQLEYPLHNLEC